MLLPGGFGGLVNASYAMDAMVHNTMWIPAHFHLIFGGTIVILYFTARVRAVAEADRQAALLARAGGRRSSGSGSSGCS